MSPKLNVVAKTCAETLAYRNKLISQKMGDYDEVIAFAREGYGLRGSVKHGTDFSRLLYRKQRIVGFGFSRNGYGTFICIKYTSEPW
uniref:SCP domain-containing protein n=1 Tax=Strongyloides papillosus TaxID=174720 RepID=A0A0N5BVF3_STREA